MKTSFALLSLATLLTPMAKAWACSPVQCSPGHAAPRDGASVPSGASSLPISPTYGGPAGAPDVQLTKDGVPIASTVVADPMAVGNFLLVPNTPLSVGTYALTRSELCPSYQLVSSPQAQVNTFNVTPAVPQPTTVGELMVSHHLDQVTASTAAGSCVVKFPGAVVTIRLVGSTELTAWAPLTRYTLTIDGREWATSAYGQFLTGTIPPDDVRSALNVFARCDGSGASDDNGLSLGVHHAELKAHIAGASTDPAPTAFDFTLSCDETSQTDGGVIVAPQDGGQTLIDSDRATSQGCSVAGTARGPSFPVGVLALIALGAWIARRRLPRMR